MNKSILLLKTALAAAIKAFAGLVAFLMTAVITRAMGAEESGLFFLAISILAFCSVFFRLGLDNAFIRILGADKGSPYSIRAISTGISWSVLAAIIFASVVFLSADLIAESALSKPDFLPVLSTMIWALPFMVVFMLLSFAFQAFYKVIIATWFQNLGVSLLFLLILLLATHFGIEISAVNLSLYYLSSAILICFFALLLWHKQINGQWRWRFRDHKLWHSASNLWAASTMSLAVQWSGILIAGIFVTSSEIAYLSAAQRTAMLISFVLIVVNMVAAPRYALLWKQGKMKDIQLLAKWSTRGMIVLALPVVTVMIFSPNLFMSLFGDEFLVAGDLLAIMALGQFINVCTGSVGYLLTMSGHEKDFRRVTLFAGPLTIILSYLLIQDYGVLGAAFATAIGLSVQNLGALVMVKKRLGFWPIG